mgnify:CR=1 FL=1
MSDMPNPFDRLLGSLEGLPDVARVKPATIRVTQPLGVGGTQLFVVQTLRQRDLGDYVFIEYVDASGAQRMMLPPEVTALVARQRDAISAKNRRKGARQAVATRKEKGIVPFAKKRK